MKAFAIAMALASASVLVLSATSAVGFGIGFGAPLEERVGGDYGAGILQCHAGPPIRETSRD